MKFRVKILLCSVWLLALLFGLGGTLLIEQSFHRAMEREKDAAISHFQMAVSAVQLVTQTSATQNLTDITATVGSMARKAGWKSVRLWLDGQALLVQGNVYRESEVESGQCAILLFHSAGRQYLQLSGLLNASQSALQLDIVWDVSDVYTQRSQQIAAYQKIFLLLLMAGGLLFWLMSAILTRPLARVSRASRELARGNYAARVQVRSDDEIGQLSRDFNAMAERLEQNVAELQDAVRRQEQFMGSFAHEMKTPMTSVIGYADLIRGQSLSPEETMRAANYIFTEGARLEALSVKLLNLLVLKHQEPEFVTAEPAQLVTALVQNLKPVYAQSHIKLQCQCAPGSCRMEPDLIRSLLTNLIDNARKAMDAGGNIYVVSDWTDGCWRLRVLDNGRGMPRQTLAHITEAFYRVDKSRSRAQGGVGLGLTLCSQIVCLHNGTMRFDSREGNGTCVTVLLKGDAP